MYSMCLLNHKPHKHTVLHQIHTIMLILHTSFDPCNIKNALYLMNHKNLIVTTLVIVSFMTIHTKK